MTRLRILACAFACAAPGTPGFTGGESALGWNLLRQIARRHEVWALTREVDRPSLEQALESDPVPNLHFQYFDLPRWLRPLLRIQGGHQIYYWLWQIKSYFVARRLHRSLGFDLFHHVTYANDWMASPIGAFLPIPYIRGPGGGSQRIPKGLDQEYSFKGRLWEKARSLGQWIFRHDPWFLIGHNRARSILLCNVESMSNLPAKWSHKASLFPVNGISSQDLAMVQSSKTSHGPFRVLSAGTLIKVKGFDLAIKAFDEFAQRCPDSKFTIIGSGPEGPKLQELARGCQAHDKIDLLPNMPRDELLCEMASYEAFLFPSLRDGGGAVVIEAMAAGKPVVCLDIGGPGMHITEECGIKITADSVQNAVRDLALALERLYLDQDLRTQMGKAARKRAEANYHWDRLGDRLMEIYQQALEPANRR